MPEYTPTTPEVLQAWMRDQYPDDEHTYLGEVEARFHRWLAAHDAEVSAQCPGVDVETIERVLTHHIVRKESGGPGCRVVDDNGWQVVEYRCSCGAWFTTDDILGHQAAQIAALAPARPSVSAEQVERARRRAWATLREASPLNSEPWIGRLVGQVVDDTIAALGIDVREVPSE